MTIVPSISFACSTRAEIKIKANVPRQCLVMAAGPSLLLRGATADRMVVLGGGRYRTSVPPLWYVRLWVLRSESVPSAHHVATALPIFIVGAKLTSCEPRHSIN